MRYEDFSAGLLRLGGGRGIPAAGAGYNSVVSVSLTPAAVAASATADQSVTIPGVDANDIIIAVRYPTQAATWLTKVTPTAANTATLTFAANATGGTPTAGVYTFLIIKTA